MSAGPHVRLATREDLADVTRLLLAFREHYGSDDPSAEAFAAGVDRLLGTDDAEFLLGAVAPDEPPVAVAQLRFRFGIWLDALDCLLEDLFVEASARGAGLGRAMVAATVERARARGARRIELDVDAENAAAVALYRSFGFGAKSDETDLYLRLRL